MVNAWDKVQEHDIATIEGFHKANPTFFLPYVIAGVMVYMTTCIPWFACWIEEHNMTPFGFFPAAKVVVWSIVCANAIHGYIACYHDRLCGLGLKIQSNKKYDWQSGDAAVRSSFVFVSQMIYAVVPMRPMSSSFAEFAFGYAILLVLGDAWFTFCHFMFHKPALYATFHKTHHKWNHPTAYAAYYIASWTHFIQEHLLTIPILFLLPVPLDAFLFYQYWGVPGAQMQHSDFDLMKLKLPFCWGFTLGNLFTLTNPLTLVLGSNTIPDHDFHHEHFVGNFGLSYNYIDRIMGTYVDPATVNNARVPLIGSMAEEPKKLDVKADDSVGDSVSTGDIESNPST